MMKSIRAAAAVLSASVVLAWPVTAQVLPFPQEPPSGLDNARYVNEVRGELERVLQEWVNAWEQGDAAAVSRFYTDEAMVVAPTGETVRGRAALAGYWAEHRSAGSDLVAAITHVSATNTLAAARGRVSYRVQSGAGAGQTRSGDMLMVFERQRGAWMTRVHAIALDPPTDMAPVATLPRAIRSTGQEARVPQVPQVRWRAEPFAGTLIFDDAFRTPAAGVAGFGLGVEVGRAAELRAGYWEGILGDQQTGLRGLTGEVRFYGFPDNSVRPYVQVGAGHVRGLVATGPLGGPSGRGSVVPTVGGGIGVDLPGRWGAHVDARTYLMVDPESLPASHWINEVRTANWSFSGGVSYSVGRAREWHDPPVTAARIEYEERVRGDLAWLLGAWLNGAHPAADQAATLYAPDARLVTPDGRRIHGVAGIAEFWESRGPMRSGSLVYEDLRASGHLATLVARIVPPGRAEAGAGTLVTVFEQVRGKWTIRSQVLMEAPAGSVGP